MKLPVQLETISPLTECALFACALPLLLHDSRTKVNQEVERRKRRRRWLGKPNEVVIALVLDLYRKLHITMVVW